MPSTTRLLAVVEHGEVVDRQHHGAAGGGRRPVDHELRRRGPTMRLARSPAVAVAGSAVPTSLPRRSTLMRSDTASTSRELVGDEDDGAAVGLELADDRQQLLDLRRREHRRRLVEDEAPGVAHQRLDDLDPLLDADGQVLDGGAGIDGQAVAGRQLLDLGAGAPCGRAGRSSLVFSTPSITFSATVKTGTSLKCWWTIPMPAAMASLGPLNCTGSPSSSTSPSSAWYRPKSTFISVDLPAPFSPSSAWTSPGSNVSDTSSLATTPGNRLVMPRSSTRMIDESSRNGGVPVGTPPSSRSHHQDDQSPMVSSPLMISARAPRGDP